MMSWQNSMEQDLTALSNFVQKHEFEMLWSTGWETLDFPTVKSFIFVFFTNYDGNKIKDEMGNTCSIYGRDEKCLYKILVGKHEGSILEILITLLL